MTPDDPMATRRPLGAIDEAEMIAEFLRGELTSPRFGPALRERLARAGVDVEILERPDLTSATDNARRMALLRDYRGPGGAAPLLEGLPEGIAWERARLTPAQIETVRYIDYPFWNALSDGTRSPVRAAERLRAGVADRGRLGDAFERVAARLCAGERLASPILVAPRRGAPLVILEGHTRVTAMVLRPDCAPAHVDVIAGYTAGIADWPFYGDLGAR